MSQIRNQGIANAIISFAGVALGYLYTGILGPYIFTPEQIGLTSTLMAVALISSHLARWGAPYMAIRFYPAFAENSKARQALLNFLLLITISGFIFFVIIYLLFQPWIIERFSDRSPLFAGYNRMVLLMVLFMAFFELLQAYSRAVLRTVMPAIMREIVWRLLVIAFMIAFHYGLVSFHTFVWVYATGYALPVLIMTLYLLYHKEVHLSTNLALKGRAGEMLKYGRYVFIGTVSTVTINEVDKIMIADMIGLDSTGIYQVTSFFSQVILVPGRSIMMIAAPLVAGFIANNEMDKVERIYKKSSINQLIAGLFIFAGIYVNLDNIFQILPPEYAAGRYVVILLSLSKLFDLATGINGEIIINSKYYRYDLFFNVALVLLILLGNYLLIPLYGINGAAMASATVILLYNAAKSWFLWIVYRMQPFSAKTLVIIAVAVAVIFLNYFLPPVDNLIADILYRSTIMTIVYGTLVLAFKVSPDVNDTVSKALAKAGLKR